MTRTLLHYIFLSSIEIKSNFSVDLKKISKILNLLIEKLNFILYMVYYTKAFYYYVFSAKALRTKLVLYFLLKFCLLSKYY